MAGGTPIMVPAIGVCDGIAMGHKGMKYSLASRELIADSVETMANAHCFDGLVLVPNCDKIVPGMIMAAARINIPSIVVSGGPMLAGEIKAKPVKFKIVPQSLYPNYKPSTGKMIAEDISSGWELLIKAEPEMVGRISPNGSDEELLAFAEESENDAVQFALISYVEILIEMEGCEIVYKERLLKYEQKRLEREIYEEHEKRIRRINRYIEAIKAKKFPVDAEKLVKNYFKTAAKDAEGAFQVLTHNPAIFSPIEFSKIKPRLFGLLKVKPSDGIRINHALGEFLRKLKV